jgi:uncharacterized membrane protein/protein-disulfide isomerase
LTRTPTTGYNSSSVMTKVQARLALVCAIVGLGASVAAAYVHYHLLFDPHYTSFCDVNATVSCTQVYQSRFSTFLSIPVAVFGAIWFAVAALLSVGGMAAPQNVRESIPGYLFVLSTLALSVILYLAYASFFIIKAVCVLCLATYAAVIGLFIVSGAAVSFPMTTLPRRMTRDVRVFIGSPVAVTLAVLLLAGAGTTLAFFPRESVAAAAPDSGAVPVATQDQRSEFERWYAAQPRVPLIIASGGAKVLVVKFNDFQCPACGQSYLQYKPIFAKYDAENPGEVKLVLKDFPLNAECNSAVARTLHPAACDAAVAVRLAAQHNRADALEDWLYTHQPDMTGPSVRTWANEKGGVPEPEFTAKYAATLALVKSDIALGVQLRVQSTPTFFINGVKVEGGLPPQYFDQAIAYELQRATPK